MIDFSKSMLEILKTFADEYIRLSELIILFDIDSIEEINEEEKKIITSRLIGEVNRFSNMSDKQIKYYFLKRKLEIVKNNLNNKSVQKVLAMLNTHVKNHSVERKQIGISFQNNSYLTPEEIVVNYDFISEKIKEINASLNIYENYKK